MYGYQCEYCDGTVEERIVTEDFRHRGELVILHNVPVGICNCCRTRYYNAKVLNTKPPRLYLIKFDSGLETLDLTGLVNLSGLRFCVASVDVNARGQ